MTDNLRNAKNESALSTDDLMGDLGGRTARGGVIAIAGQFASTLVQLAYVVILTRILLPEDFGLIAMAATVTGFVSLFTDLGLSTATIQRKEIGQGTVSTLFFINLAMGLAVMFSAWAISPFAASFYGDPRAQWVIVAMAAAIPISAAGAQYIALLNRRMRWFTIRWTMLAGQSAALLVAGAAAWLGDMGYWALIFGHWTNVLVLTGLVWTQSPWRPDWVCDWTGARSALKLGINVTGANFVNYFQRQLDNILIGWRWGAVELGFYNRAYGILLLPQSLIAGPLSTAVIPGLSRLQDDVSAWRQMVLNWTAIAGILSLLPAAVIIANSHDVVALLFGSRWSQAGDILQILGLSLVARAFMNANSWIYISTGRTGRMFRWTLTTLPFYVAGFAIGLEYGGRGVAFGFSAAQYLLVIPSILVATRETEVSAREIIMCCVPALAVLVVAVLISAFVSPIIEAAAPPLLASLLNVVVTTTVYILAIAAAAILLPSLRPLRRQAVDHFKRMLKRRAPKA